MENTKAYEYATPTHDSRLDRLVARLEGHRGRWFAIGATIGVTLGLIAFL